MLGVGIVGHISCVVNYSLSSGGGAALCRNVYARIRPTDASSSSSAVVCSYVIFLVDLSYPDPFGLSRLFSCPERPFCTQELKLSAKLRYLARILGLIAREWGRIGRAHDPHRRARGRGCGARGRTRPWLILLSDRERFVHRTIVHSRQAVGNPVRGVPEQLMWIPRGHELALRPSSARRCSRWERRCWRPG